MTQEELVAARAMHVVQELNDLKRLEAHVEVALVKVEKCLQNHLKRIEAVKKDLVRLVANEAEDVKQIDEMCEIIRKLNGILDFERNVKWESEWKV